MKRPAAPKTPDTFQRKRSLKELWKRLLTEDDLDAVHGGGEVSPISGGRPCD